MESEIVITGMSGRFPESDNVAEFSHNLFNKVDIVTESTKRWEPGLYGLPRCMGQIKDISKFDANFFGVHHKQAHQLDPQARILLELTYETIVDAGYDPDELRGKNIGVFIGNCSSESDEFFTLDAKKINGYAMTGCCRAMFANRVSYTFDFKGPSFLMDTACSSGALALYEAVQAIKNNECEAAIVGGANLCLRPGTALQFYKLNMLSDNGKCKSFDALCDGYGRSEAVVSLMLQKANVARRKYATIVHVKTNTDGHKEQGVTFPSAHMQKRLIQEVYEESKLNPLKVSFVEAHGTGTPAGDPIEMSAISEIFCKGRKEPLLVGAVKSNMGHSEPSSGLCSLVKVLIAMESEMIPPNLHFQSPNPEIPALMSGQVKIVADPVPWQGDYAALSCFGFGGVNVHAVLKANPKKFEPEKNNAKFPQLALYAGRTEENVKILFDHLDERIQREFFALLHKSVYAPAQMKPYRGYKVIAEDGTTEIKKAALEKRPVWYIFSGMGTQWPAMAKDLMELEVFAKTIRKVAVALEPYGIDLISLVTNGGTTKTGERTIIPAFVSIAAVQVALVDVLTELGIEPDGMVGHSVGELGCAYADGCFTAEQMVLAAYWRGKAVEDSNLIDGAMAALGLTWKDAKKRCPKAVFPSCHNAEDSITVSGPKEDVQKFVSSLKEDNVFAREVDSCGYAFHSQYIFPAAEKLKNALNQVIPKPKPRTARWISSSYPEEDWVDPASKVADAAYFVHNLVSPVLFHEALRFVPKDALVIEIAPHHLLQAILKRVIGSKAEYIGLMKRNVNNSHHLLSSIGKIYNAGSNPSIEKLYPQVSLPVPKGTPMISPLIKWDHSESWDVANWNKRGHHSQMIVEVDVGRDDSPDKYLFGHCIDGRHLYPATGYLMLVWKALAELKSKDFSETPIVFENVKIHRATVLSSTNVTKLVVDITSAGGAFEISEAGMTVVSGRAYIPEDTAKDGNLKYWKDTNDSEKLTKLNSNDIYKELRLRGYDYGPTFQGVLESDLKGEQGLLKWPGNWVVFLDNMLQFSMLGTTKRGLHLPTRILNMKVDPFLQQKIADEIGDTLQGIPIIHETNTQRVTAGGVELRNLKASVAPRQQGRQIPLLEEYGFVPYNESDILSKQQVKEIEKYIHVCSSVAKKLLESAGKNKDQITDVMNGYHEVDENIISAYLDNLSEKHVLLKTLQQILLSSQTNELSKATKENLYNYLQTRNQDFLESTLTSEVPLRNVLDVVLENAKSKKVKVLEVSDSSFPLSVKLQEQQSFSVAQFNFTVAHPSPSTLAKEMLNSANIQTLQWTQSATSTPDVKDIDFLVVKNMNLGKKDLKKHLQNLLTLLKEDSFVLVSQRNKLVPAELFLSAISEVPINVHTDSDMENIFKELELSIVCKKADSVVSTLYLLRKTTKDSALCSHSFVYVSNGEYDKWVEQIQQGISEVSQNPQKNLWLIAEGDISNGIIGLVNCLRQETGGNNVRCLFTDHNKLSKFPKFSSKEKFYSDILKKDLVMNVLQNGVWGSYRYVTSRNDKKTSPVQHAYVNVLTRGDLASLTWIDSPLKYFSSNTNVLCHVYYAALNFRDIMLASGKLPADAIPGDLAYKDSILGFEFSGRDEAGKRIMGLVSCKGLATTVEADREFLWNVPNHWSLEEASTVPVAYSTAYYALIVRGGLKKGEKVLIHSGSGGVGQAAIAIALSLQCEVFTSVGTKEKKEFLKKRFPQLKDRNFCNSRDISFEQHILNETNGEGVDAVLNSLADEKLTAGLCCLAQHGRFLEIGKYDLSNNTPLGMAVFLKNISFHGILLDSLFQDKDVCSDTKQEIVQLVNEGIKDGTVQPLNTILFNNDQIEQAFRYMASGRHIGKVVVKIRDEETAKVTVPGPIQVPAIPCTSCDPKKTYIIIGGLGGFGLELCQWLIDRGARNVVLTSRTGVRTGYQLLCLRRWTKESINIIVSKLNATDYNDAKKLLSLASEHGEIGGIFNLALVLRDALIENQTAENYKLVCESKVSSTVNLDSLSRQLCPKLQWFVCFSSVSCGRGNGGQSNYGFANSVMERICETRHREGLPGLAIQWGAIGDVGVIQDNGVGNDAVIGGTVPQRIISCLTVMDQFLQQNHPVVSSLVPYNPSDTTGSKLSKHNVLATVANIFGIKDISTINLETTLGELGMDSLMGVEIQQFLERDHELVLSIQELRQLKIKDLQKLDGGDAADDEPKQTKSEKKDEELKLEKLKEMSSLSLQQLVPKVPIIPLNDKKKGTPLFIVHPIEGVATMLETIAKTIDCPVYGLQYTVDAPSSSVEDLAAWYLKHITNLNQKGPIHLAGYSFGSSVAFEIALHVQRQQQSHPKIASLIMLDGSPFLVTTYAREHESHFLIDSQTEGEAQAFCAFVLQFTETNIRQLKKRLFDLPNYNDRVACVSDIIVAACPELSREEVVHATDLYYKKLVMSLKYTPRYKLESDIVLLKASEGIDMAKNFSEQYDLEKVCNGTIAVYTVMGTHKTFIQGEQAKDTSKILNTVLIQ